MRNLLPDSCCHPEALLARDLLFVLSFVGALLAAPTLLRVPILFTLTKEGSVSGEGWGSSLERVSPVLRAMPGNIFFAAYQSVATVRLISMSRRSSKLEIVRREDL